MRCFLIAACLAASTLPAAAQTEAAFKRCPKLADRAARLACYDAILPPEAGAEAPPAAAPALASPAAGDRVAAAAPAAPAALAAAPPPARDAAGSFGLPRTQQPQAEPDIIESSVAADFWGWRPNQRILLANGQVWQVADGSDGTLTSSARGVKVRRGLFGAFHLEFQGLNRSPRVVRVE